MAIQAQAQQPGTVEIQQGKHFSRKRLFLVLVIIVLFWAGIWALSIFGFISPLWATLLSALFTVAGFLFGMHSFFFPSTHQIIHLLPPESPPLPAMNFTLVIQNLEIVEDIYNKLIEAETTALVLTGVSGVGKSTFAALVYHYAEQQRREGKGPFTAQALWLRIDYGSTVSSLAGRVMGGLDKNVPNFGSLPPQNQALAVINALETTDEPRLVILDQFENLLERGRLFGSSPGVNELLDALNGPIFEKAKCRVLLTNNSMLVGTDGQPLMHIEEYPIAGLNIAESLELLAKKGLKVPPKKVEEQVKTVDDGDKEAEDAEVQGIDKQLDLAVSDFHGHPLSLTLLASALRNDRRENLADFVYDSKYAQIRTGNILLQLFDYIYEQLKPEERELLIAFSVFREPIDLYAAKSVVRQGYEVTDATLNSLLDQYLLMKATPLSYQLHPALVRFAQRRFDARGSAANLKALQDAHHRAALHYLQLARTDTRPPEQRWGFNDLHAYVEATWQYCRATMFQEASDLMEEKDIPSQLFRVGGIAVLLELYQLLFPLDRWHPKRIQEAHIKNNLGEVYVALEKYGEAVEYFKLALPLFKEEEDLLGEARALNNLGFIYNTLGQEKLFWVNLELTWESLELTVEARTSLEYTKKTRKYREQEMDAERYLRQAWEYLAQALQIRKEQGDREGIGITQYNLGQLFSALRNKEEALRYYKEAQAIFREVDDRLQEGRILYQLSWIFNSMGKKGRVMALESLDQALRIQKEVGDRLGEGATFDRLGRVFDDIGEKYEAWKCYLRALQIEREVGDVRGMALTLHNLGTLYFEQGPHEEMMAFILHAKSILKEMQGPIHERAQRQIEVLRAKIGKKEFTTLFEKVQQNTAQIVNLALEQGLSGELELQPHAYLSISLPTANRKKEQKKSSVENDVDHQQSEAVESDLAEQVPDTAAEELLFPDADLPNIDEEQQLDPTTPIDVQPETIFEHPLMHESTESIEPETVYQPQAAQEVP